MKANKLFALAAIAALALASCKKEDPAPVFEPSLKVDKTEKIAAPAEGTTATVKVTANISWAATASQDWVTVSPASKSITDKKSVATDLTITIPANEAYEARTATVTLKAEDCNDIVLNIEQAGSEKPQPKFTVTDEEGNPISAVEAEWEASSTFVVVDANIDWTAVSSDESWLTVDPAAKEDEQTISTISWTANDDSEAREATITFSAEGFDNVVITVSQNGRAPFTAEIDAMSVTEYIGQPMELYPDWSCIVTYVGMPSVPAVAGSYGVFKASNWADIIADWDNKKEEAIAKVDEYGDALVEEDLEQINELEDEDAMAYWVFMELDPETEYVFVTKLVDADGRVWIGYALQTTAAEPKSEWVLYGKGHYKDGYISDLFTDLEPKEIDVDIYQDSLDPNHFAMFNPYGPEMLVNWMYGPTVTLEQIIAAKGQVWDDTFYEFNIDAAKGTAFVKLQPLGFIHSTYGAFQAGMSYAYIPEAKAYYKDGKVTIDPEEGAVIVIPSLGKVYYSNEAGDFEITMPTANAAKKTGKTDSLKQEKAYRCYAKYLTSKPNLNFSVIDELKYGINLKLVK